MGKIADILAGASDLLADEVMYIELEKEEGGVISADDARKLRRAESLDSLIDKAARLASKWGF